MEREDGRDPFDPQTYYAENCLTITTMVELRVFCASFFESHVRHNMDPTPKDTVTKFIKLITDSNVFFARARAVIPELQVPNTVSFHEDVNICRILLETQRFRGPPGKKWSIHADDSAWSKLSNDGRAIWERKASEQGEQDGDVSARLVTSGVKEEVEGDWHKTKANSVDAPLQSPDLISKEEIEAKEPRRQDSNRSALVSPPNITKIKPKLEIRTFIPRSASSSEQLVWSPTQGTRPRRPDEVYQMLATSPAPSILRHQEMPSSDAPKEFEKDLSGERKVFHTGVPLHNSAPLSPPSRAPDNQSPFGPIGQGSASRNKHASTTDAVLGHPTPVTFQDSVHRPDEQQRQNGGHQTSVSSGMNSPKYTGNGTRSVPGVESFSAAPNLARLQGRQHSSQGRYSRRSNYFQPSLHPLYHTPLTESDYLASNSDSGELPPAQPPAQPLAQETPYQATGSAHFFIPAQGLMKPIDYWDMLYQLEVHLRESLQEASEPMTQFHWCYIAQLEQARMMAIRTKLPHRGRMSKKMWLLALEREMQSIWTQGPGQIEDSPTIVARKRDYEKIVNEEMRKACLEV